MSAAHAAAAAAAAHERHRRGAMAEDLAAAFLARQGIEVLLRNYRRRLGELDVIGREGDVLVIAEVRTRASTRYGGAAASIDAAKRQRMVRAAQQLLQKRRDLRGLRARFDVIIVHAPHSDAPRIEWIRHAFDT